MSSLLRDIRHSVRTLRQSPGFTAVAVLTLAIGIGANTAIFSFVDAMLLKPLPYPDADRIVRVMEKPPRGERNGISTLNFLDWQRDNTVFDFMSAQTGDAVTLTGGSEPVQIRGGLVSAGYFKVFGAEPALGRTFLPGEDQLGKHQVAVISHSLWMTQFGGDPTIVNRTVLLNNEPHAIVGVLPATSAFDRAPVQIWRPLAFKPSNMTRDFHWMVSFARLKDGVTLAQARANMDAIGKRIENDFPASNKGWGVVVEPYAETLINAQARTILLLLISSTGFLLLIGCANLANLALARGVSREREVVVRASLGAGRWDLIRQFLTENVLLSLCGGSSALGDRLFADERDEADAAAVHDSARGQRQHGRPRSSLRTHRLDRDWDFVRNGARASSHEAGSGGLHEGGGPRIERRGRAASPARFADRG